jgi:hypothetical protein
VKGHPRFAEPLVGAGCNVKNVCSGCAGHNLQIYWSTAALSGKIYRDGYSQNKGEMLLIAE